MLSRREHLDERDMGISRAAAAALGPLLEEPVEIFIKHLVLPKGAKTPAWEPSRTACGVVGVEPNTNVGTTSEHSVSCGACKAKIAERHAEEDFRSLRSVAKAPVRRIKLHGPRRDRLELAGLVVVSGDFVAITDAGRARLAALKPAKAAAPKLTPAQQKRVRELIEDEGHTRAAAVAWVLNFEKGAA